MSYYLIIFRCTKCKDGICPKCRYPILDVDGMGKKCPQCRCPISECPIGKCILSQCPMDDNCFTMSICPMMFKPPMFRCTKSRCPMGHGNSPKLNKKQCPHKKKGPVNEMSQCCPQSCPIPMCRLDRCPELSQGLLPEADLSMCKETPD